MNVGGVGSDDTFDGVAGAKSFVGFEAHIVVFATLIAPGILLI